ncbi:putative E3 ubiquitin-protein ligase HECTD2 [Gossypium arboreum]|uniref:Putative E3 ubiquitin-protein ligase HECTD2 n=1 Tax=Gossypium arboreum TaxID=29729 RepID=A0A0B0PMC6_GOSAR|nr:putative E3 ubiquitin-protein ligase HECTD2 [Gossypium arboreum]
MQGVKPSGTMIRGRPPRILGGRGGSQRGTSDTAVRSETRAPTRAYAIRAREEASSPDVITDIEATVSSGDRRGSSPYYRTLF